MQLHGIYASHISKIVEHRRNFTNIIIIIIIIPHEERIWVLFISPSKLAIPERCAVVRLGLYLIHPAYMIDAPVRNKRDGDIALNISLMYDRDMSAGAI